MQEKTSLEQFQNLSNLSNMTLILALFSSFGMFCASAVMIYVNRKNFVVNV